MPLDDCLYAPQATVQAQVKAYAIGYFHIDIAEVRTAEGKFYLFVAVHRTSKYAFVQLMQAANMVTACSFLDSLIAAVPYKIHTV